MSRPEPADRVLSMGAIPKGDRSQSESRGPALRPAREEVDLGGSEIEADSRRSSSASGGRNAKSSARSSMRSPLPAAGQAGAADLHGSRSRGGLRPAAG